MGSHEQYVDRQMEYQDDIVGAEEFIDVEGAVEYYEDVDTMDPPIRQRVVAGSQQHYRPAPYIQQSSSFSARGPQSQQFIVRQSTSHIQNFEPCEIKATVLKPSSSYDYTPLNQRSMQGSILANTLSAPKTKSKKGTGKRKSCNCTKSQCLKLYCECYANGEFCLDCTCKDCHNNLDHEAERSRAIKASLERNPHAFKPKIGVSAKVGRSADMERLHQKGCHCRKSNCLKNYCECYEAKVPCTNRCKCNSCRNTEQERSQRFREKFSAAGLAQLAAAAACENKDECGDGDSDDDREDVDPKSQPWFYMTEDVIEATTMCLVSYVQEMENNISHKTEEEVQVEMERGILLEFSRCICQIVESAKGSVKQIDV